jgi:hypothetical protein
MLNRVVLVTNDTIRKNIYSLCIYLRLWVDTVVSMRIIARLADGVLKKHFKGLN